MLYAIVGICVLALLVAFALASRNKRIVVDNARLNELAGYIRSGAMAYLARQYRVLLIFVIALFLLLCFLPGMGWQTAVCFLLGACMSALAGYFGMRSATTANVRTAHSAMKGTDAALRVAFTGGSVMGLCVVGLGLLGIILAYLIFGDLRMLTGFSFGASSIALFARVGGGIYTKAADVGADLVGKVEAGIPEDDPRNPAVIADNVGDNVGDVAGMGADLFESYVGAILSALLLGIAAFGDKGAQFTFMLCGAGVLTSIASILLVRSIKGVDPAKVIRLGTYISTGIIIVLAAVLSNYIFGGWNQFVCVICGVISGMLIGLVTEYYTSDEYGPVKDIAEQSKTGPATNILAGLAVGNKSTAIPTVLIVAAVIVSFQFGGLFGVALAAVGMLCTVGTTIAVDAYGPISDNAGGIAEMGGMPPEVRKITDRLDAIGNTTAAIGKGFSIGSAALTALALFSSFADAAGIEAVNLLNPRVIGGALLGGMLCYLFAALTIEAVSKAANNMIEEVRRQFREIPGIMEGTGTPEYAKCVDISTKAALNQMIIPGLIAVVAPILTGLVLGVDALCGLLLGATICGVMCAIQMSNSGGAWDNAKKLVESMPGGKGTDTHAATVIGDTVGDPLKDTSGPSMNILIKLMSIVSLVFVPLFL